jgi:uncharacterized membrane protein YtjA (UPF0391 family)
MLMWSLILFLIACVAGIMGFGGFVAGSLMLAAKVCFLLFLVLFIVSLFAGRTYGPPAI